MTDQPRTPAGSPDGGQFAATAGAEAQGTIAPPGDVGVEAILASGIEAAATAAAAAFAARTTELATMLEWARTAIIHICPDATHIRWEWCGDGDAPTTLDDGSVVCPHVGRDGAELHAFTTAHNIDEGAADLLAELTGHIDERDMSRFGNRSGVLGPNDRCAFLMRLDRHQAQEDS